MIVLDANVVIAFFDPNDRHHHRAAALLSDHAAEGFRMHPLTLAEVLVGAVRVGRGNQRFGELKSLGIVAHLPDASEPLTLAELRAATGLKMPDCCALAVAQHEASAIATFDESLAGAARRIGVETLS